MRDCLLFGERQVMTPAYFEYFRVGDLSILPSPVLEQWLLADERELFCLYCISEKLANHSTPPKVVAFLGYNSVVIFW